MNEGLRGQTWGWNRAKGSLGMKKETSPGWAREAYSEATLLLRKLGVPGRGKLRPPRVSRSQSRAMWKEGLPRSRSGRRPEGRRPGASAAPSPGVSTRDTPPPAPDSAAAAAEQSHPRLCRGTRLLQAVGVGGVRRGRAPQPQHLAPGSSSSASQGQTPTPEAAMMDYESPHNEARPRPRPRPQRRRNPLREVRRAAGAALLHAAAPSGSSFTVRDSPAPHAL